MKVYICGSVGSGKTTAARRLSEQTKWPNWSLDDLTWIREPVAKKRSEQERIAMVNEICQREDFIIEGAQLGWIGKTTLFDVADLLIVLEPRPLLVRWRIDSRFVKQCLHVEKAAYQPTWQGLKDMHRWQRQYDQTDKWRIRDLVNQAKKTVTVCHDFEDVWQAVHQDHK
ncbi:MAG TPA: DNA topology modulation protein FlaR [Lactobacillus sp.]|nr:DNA topology modulation protein FlaR [Lactobacillus sp.]